MSRKLPLSATRGMALLVYAGVALAAAAAASAAGPAAPRITAGSGWTWRVAAEDLPGVDNLVVAPDGSLYATLELARGEGKVIRWHRGRITTLLGGLNHPDGLLWRGRSLYVTEEADGGRVLAYDLATRNLRTLATLHRPEGIDMLPDGDLVVAEDSLNGRLLRVSQHGRHPVEVMLGGLSRPEGVAVAPDGAVVFAETETGRVLRYKEGDLTVVVDDLDEPDQVEFAPDGALWITEDVVDARLLRLKNGALETVLSGLHAPQGMAFGADGTVWLAEQGRGRILAVSRDTTR
jgi:sugar lactone lactonase YvrE